MTKPVQHILIKHITKNKAFYTKNYLGAEDRRDLISATSDQASMLYEYYLRMVAVADAEITDATAANYFGWDIQKSKRYRRSLTKAGYFSSARFTMTNGEQGMCYYIGKDAQATAWRLAHVRRSR